MNLTKQITILFDYFYNKVYKANFKLDLSKNNQMKMVDNFIALLAKQYGIDCINATFLIEYFLHSFSYFTQLDTKRNISLGWIIGKKMVKRFEEKNKHASFFSRNFANEYNINILQLQQQLFEEENEEIGLSTHEELEKQRFYGVAKLYNCLQNTTMYNHKSKICMVCDQRSDCKNLLLKKNPKLYTKRGYNKANI
jgi:hypothetical protein